MTFIRCKGLGNRYAYEVTSYWDKKEKRPRQKARYLGVVVNKKKGIFKKPLKDRFMKEEKSILDFGNSFLLHEFFKKNRFIQLLEESFGDDAGMLFTLISYRLCNPAAMRLARIWQQGNMIKHLCRNIDVSSQRISDFMVRIGDEDICRRFFDRYLSFVRHSPNSLVLDITALPNQVHMPFSQWGYSDEQIDKQIKLMLVVDKESSLPLFFRYIPGSIADVSTMKPTIEELNALGINGACFIFDAGFFSEGNIRSLQTDKADFLIRLPSLRRLYKELIRKECNDIESIKYAIKYGKRGLFVKGIGVSLFDKKAFAYIVLDPKRKGRETDKMLLKVIDEIDKEKGSQEMDFMLKRKGIMILVSSFSIRREDIVPLYYSRQMAERMFGFSKDDLKLLPLRIHKEESMRGYLLYMFICLSAFLALKKELGKDITVEEALLSLRNLKVKVFEKEMIIPELTKEQKEIYEKLGIIVPKVLGI